MKRKGFHLFFYMYRLISIMALSTKRNGGVCKNYRSAEQLDMEV
ncbi:MAG: hypothetical protein ACTTJ6_03970 [Treponema sp.]